MTTTNYSDEAESPAAEPSQLLKTDVLGRTRMCRAQREAILDTFEASGMSGQAFALQHGIKIQTFASWIQKRRHAREWGQSLDVSIFPNWFLLGFTKLSGNLKTKLVKSTLLK